MNPIQKTIVLLMLLVLLTLSQGTARPVVGQSLDPVPTPFSTDVLTEWLHEVLPMAETFGEKQGNPATWPGYRTNAQSRQRELVGYAFLSADVPPIEPGYSAAIDMLVGIDADFNMTGVKILDYEETYLRIKGDFLAQPGLLNQFRKKAISDEFQIDQDIDGIAGSTVSVFAIARGARNAARQIAEIYLDYDPDDPVREARNTRVRELMGETSWEDMLTSGTMQQMQITLADGAELKLSFAYMGTEGLGDFWVGKDKYALAERTASVYHGGDEILLVAVGGNAADKFQHYQLQVKQDNSVSLNWFRRFTADSYVSLGKAETNLLAGRAQLIGAIVLPKTVDITRIFTLAYRHLNTTERFTIEIQLNGLPLRLAQGNDVLSTEEIESILRAEDNWLSQLIKDPPWGVTPWFDITILLFILVSAMTSFLRKHEHLRWITLAMTVVYLGFFDGSFISVSHIINSIKLGPAFLLSGLPLLLFATFTIVTTLLWGRIFCSSLCPFGAVQDFLTRFAPRRWRRPVSQALHDKAIYLKYCILTLIIGAAALAAEVSIFQYFEPFGTLFFLNGTLILWVILIAILAACLVVPRFYCRYGCPLGAALGVASLLSPLRIRRVPQCDVCVLCEHACPTGAIRRGHIDFKECVRCDICETKLIEQTGSCRHSMERIIASTHPVSSNSESNGVEFSPSR